MKGNPKVADLNLSEDHEEALMFLKELTLTRISLMNMRQSVIERMKSYQDVIASTSSTPSMVAQAVTPLVELSETLKGIDDRIKALDSTQVSAMEAIFGDVSFEMSLPEKFDSIGGLVEHYNAVFSTSKKTLDRFKSRLDPSSLWAYQTLKAMFKPTDITIVKNEKY